jgi:NAD(P)-dependent dehydrogenase (short-subunit alcohol dehydrogenase family)
VRVVQQVLPAMRAQGGGQIVLISSVAHGLPAADVAAVGLLPDG